MDANQATDRLAALSQTTRLEAFRLLVRHEPNGLPAGEVARRLAIPQNTMSTHLAVLARANLCLAERQSRAVIYRANLEALRELMLFLIKDCCGGNAELCAPLIADLACSPRCSAGIET